MKVGVFSVIDWSFLDQRPQILAKKLAEWGHEVVYFEPFFKLHSWSDSFNHPWEEYETCCWSLRKVYPGVEAMQMLWLPAHKSIAKILHKNQFYKEKIKKTIADLRLDLAVVIDPSLGRLMDELEIPYIYDHVDDTHQMEAVLKEFWHEEQQYSAQNSVATLYIQPNIARRYKGLYVPNGIDTEQLDVSASGHKDFDAGCLSTIADWFDLDSVLKTSKKMLIIGPMDLDVKERYDRYRKDGGCNVTWLPRVSRKVAAHWLTRCKTAMVPFNDEHPVVDYVMPLKLVEYLYLGLPSISYLNKGIEEEFGDIVTFYSSVGWRGLPNLDSAIDHTINHVYDIDELKSIASQYTWDNVLEDFKCLITEISRGSLKYNDTAFRSRVYCENCETILIRNKSRRRDMGWFYSWRSVEENGSLSLPPYLDLFFQLFPNEFTGDDVNEKKLSFLVWVLTTTHDEKIISRGGVDPKVFEIMDATHKSCTGKSTTSLSNFEHTFIRTNQKAFRDWGYHDDDYGLEKQLSWIYTYGYENIGGAYLEHAIVKYLENSGVKLKNGFELSKIMQLLIKCNDVTRHISGMEPDEVLLVNTAYMLFNYNSNKCPISEWQVNCLSNSSCIMYDLINVYERYYSGQFVLDKVNPAVIHLFQNL